MSRLSRYVVGIFLFALVAMLSFGVWVVIELNTPYLGFSEREVFVDIPRGASAAKAAELLAQTGVIRHRLPLEIYVRYTKKEKHIKAGEYRFAERASPKEIVERLIQGDVFFLSVTIPEGLTARETTTLIAQSGLGDMTQMQRALRNTEWIRDLNPSADSLEGYLFPETYRFPRKTDSATIIRTLVDQFRSRINKITELHPIPPGWTLSKIVILASLIEKEVKDPREGPLVASVLVNRLEKKMPLACDATIIYAMKLAGTYEGRLGKADLRMESPYNSYLHAGLPPGPICNPGPNSLKAALKPAKTDFYYYVSRNDGTHQFSRDYATHLRAVNLYQRSRPPR